MVFRFLCGILRGFEGILRNGKFRRHRFQLLGLLVELGLYTNVLGLVFGHGLVPLRWFPVPALLAPRKAVQRPHAPIEPVLHLPERHLVREELLPRELSVPQRHETEMRVRGLLVHVHRKVNHVRFAELVAAEPVRVIEELAHLVVIRPREEFWTRRHDSLNEFHSVLAHLALARIPVINPRLYLALVIDVRAHLAVQTGSGLVYVGVRVLPRLAVVVVLHGTYRGTLALLDSKDCVLLPHRRRHLPAFWNKRVTHSPFTYGKEGAPTVYHCRFSVT